MPIRSFAWACASAPAWLALGLHLALAMPSQADPAVWQDRSTGLALGGVDPLSYMTEGEKRPGDPGHEYVWGGAVWRFVNAGNRAAFIAHPDVYAPAFAGYDAYALADGKPVAGHPALAALHKGRLYLFHSEESRRRWSLDPDGVAARAKELWPAAAARLPENPHR